MSTIGVVSIFLTGYLALNFVCALALHVHGEKQAHLRLRFLDILVHFVVMTAFAIPVLMVTTVEALFGGEGGRGARKPGQPSHAGARAA